MTIEPALSGFGLLLIGAWFRLCHRADSTAWREKLARYADLEDSCAGWERRDAKST
jgi:hypothetical protein